MSRPTSQSVPKEMQPYFEAVVALTDQFCRERLTEEYAELARKMVAALCRKRPSPLLTANVGSWASGIIYAMAQVNFLFDRDNPHYMSATDLAGAFGLAKTTAGTRGKAVRDALKIGHLDWHWAVPSRQADYPGAWYIEVGGLVVDARSMPRAIQEEAYRKGYIPFVPEPRSPS